MSRFGAAFFQNVGRLSALPSRRPSFKQHAPPKAAPCISETDIETGYSKAQGRAWGAKAKVTGGSGLVNELAGALGRRLHIVNKTSEPAVKVLRSFRPRDPEIAASL